MKHHVTTSWLKCWIQKEGMSGTQQESVCNCFPVAISGRPKHHWVYRFQITDKCLHAPCISSTNRSANNSAHVLEWTKLKFLYRVASSWGVHLLHKNNHAPATWFPGMASPQYYCWFHESSTSLQSKLSLLRVELFFSHGRKFRRVVI
jgi:hypothetical protein